MVIVAAISLSLIIGFCLGLFFFAAMIGANARRNGGAYVFYAHAPQKKREARLNDRSAHQAGAVVFGE
jgi:hypothetical protein